MELLEGERYKSIEEEEERKGERWLEEGEVITEEEVKKQIRRLKKGKAAGEDELETCIYGSRNITARITKLINKVWRGESMPEG